MICAVSKYTFIHSFIIHLILTKAWSKCCVLLLVFIVKNIKKYEFLCNYFLRGFSVSRWWGGVWVKTKLKSSDFKSLDLD